MYVRVKYENISRLLQAKMHISMGNNNSNSNNNDDNINLLSPGGTFMVHKTAIYSPIPVF